MKKYLLGVLVFGIVGCSDTGRNSNVGMSGRAGVRPVAVADISPSAPAGYNSNYNVNGGYNANVLNPIQPIQPIQPMAVQPIQPVEPVATNPSFTAQPIQSAAAIPAARSSSGTYTVQKGDTLSKIARDRYGDAKQWHKIAAANPGLSPNSIKAGQKINIP